MDQLISQLLGELIKGSIYAKLAAFLAVQFTSS